VAQLPKGIRKHTSRDGYEVRITARDPHAGVSRRVSAYAKSLPEAKEKLRDMEARSRQHLLARDSQMTLADWAAEWTATVLPHKELADSTKTLYGGLLVSHLVSSSIGRTKLCNLQPLQFEKFFRAELGNASASLRRNIYAVVSHLFKDAIRARLIATTPLRDVPRPKAIKNEARFVSQAELERLLESLKSSRYADVFNLILQTGLRRGEVLALSWNDVNLQNSQMQVKASLSANKQRGSLKTIKSQRTLDLNPVALAILKRQKARQNLERLSLGELYSQTGWDPVFTNESGSPVCPRGLLRTLQNAASKAGLTTGSLGSIGIHTLRHFVASKLLTSGVDILVVSRILGHDSIQTTVDIYGHMEDSTRKSALALLA
jgi:integrase